MLFRDSPLELKLPSEVNISLPNTPEDGMTFMDNATKKAKGLAAVAKQWSLADDSGLEVDVLGGAPGIRSARFAGERATDGQNTTKLLKVLRSARKRKARFVCALALAGPNGELVTATGKLEGEISSSPEGESGFGYDPIFFVPGLGRTLGMVSFNEKLRISHRARAVELLLSKI